MATTSSKGALLHQDPNYAFPVLERGEGIYLYDEEGRRYIDGAAGAGNVTLGHGRQRIAAAMAEQAELLGYCFSAHFSNRVAIEFAERLALLAPGDLNHAYFVSGGSEGIETALKLAFLYHRQRGNGQKQLVISRWRGYHGATLGALAVTGTTARNPFANWLLPFPHIAPCYPYRCSFVGCEGKCNLTCANELEKAIRQTGPENVAAFVAEPVVLGGIAIGVPPPDYFSRIREICDKYDVLFIADEVITGFGRTGKLFAIEHWDTVPDMIVFAKGVSSGYIPLGGVLFKDVIRQVLDSADQGLPHVFTAVNNPVAMRVGSTVLDIIEEEGILEHVREVGDYLLKRALELRKYRMVGDVRGKGLMLGIELVRDRDTKEPFEASLEVHKRIRRILLEKGLSAGASGGTADWKSGDDLRLYPPLIITREQVDEVIAIVDEGLAELERELELFA